MAGHLLRQAEIQSGCAERGSVVDLGATREVVAASLGTVREVFVRTLRGFERQGFVAIDGRRVEIREPAALRDVSEDAGRRAGAGATRQSADQGTAMMHPDLLPSGRPIGDHAGSNLHGGGQ